MLVCTEARSVYIRKPLEGFFRSVETAYEEHFGRERTSSHPEEATLYALPAEWFAPGTVNCLAAPPRLSIPLFLRFMLDHADASKESASLFVSHLPPEELIFRMTAYYSRIGINRLRRAQLGTADWPHLVRIASRIYESNIFFCRVKAPVTHSIIRELLHNHSQRAEPLGLILLNGFPVAVDTQVNRLAVEEELAVFREIAAEFKVSIVYSNNEDPATLVMDRIDLFMTVHSCGGRYKLLFRHDRQDVSGEIPLMLIPEIGVMEDA